MYISNPMPQFYKDDDHNYYKRLLYAPMDVKNDPNPNAKPYENNV